MRPRRERNIHVAPDIDGDSLESRACLVPRYVPALSPWRSTQSALGHSGGTRTL